MKEYIATIQVKEPHFNKELLKAIEKAGYTLVREYDFTGEAKYIIAKEVNDE